MKTRIVYIVNAYGEDFNPIQELESLDLDQAKSFCDGLSEPYSITACQQVFDTYLWITEDTETISKYAGEWEEFEVIL